MVLVKKQKNHVRKAAQKKMSPHSSSETAKCVIRKVNTIRFDGSNIMHLGRFWLHLGVLWTYFQTLSVQSDAVELEKSGRRKNDKKDMSSFASVGGPCHPPGIRTGFVNP